MIQLTSLRAAEIVREHYGIEGGAALLYGEKDLNFLIKAPPGEYVLKVANPCAVREDLEFQIRVMQHASRGSLPILVPRILANQRGEALTSVGTAEGHQWAHLLTFLPGVLWADCKPHTARLRRELGNAVGSLDAALRDLPDPGGNRELKWNLSKAGWIREHLDLIQNRERRELVNRRLNAYEEVLPKLEGFRRQVIYNDANDHNIVCSLEDPGNRKVAGLIDFGDTVESQLICDLAITCTYAVMGKGDPIGAACEVVTGFHEVNPLDDAELEVLFPLILMRLCVSITNAALQKRREPANDYLQISAAPAWALLEQLDQIDASLATYRFRAACGFVPVPSAPRVEAWLLGHPTEIAGLVELDLKTCPKVHANWDAGSLDLANPQEYENPDRLTVRMWANMAQAGASVAIGGYNRARLVPEGEVFRAPANEGCEWRSVHLGLDLFQDAGAAVFAPFDGIVHSFANNLGRYEYGPCIVLEHRFSDADGSLVFWTLYGHLSPDSLEGLHPGKLVKKGARLASLGIREVNGGWPPHLHFQIITDMLGKCGDFPGACTPSQREVWCSLSPDPNLVGQIPREFFPEEAMEAHQILEERHHKIGYNLSISYEKKLHIVRGYKQWLYNAEGQRYLDCVNNVPHVGHCHPRVVEAGQRQMAVLNTNTRYLHELLVRYAERLTENCPEPLRVCFLVNSGSEANELALRLARAHTRQKDMVVVDAGYHGNTTSIIDISSYKFDHKGGMGAPDWVHKAIMPDRYRGPYKANDPAAGLKYAHHIGEAVTRIPELPRPYQDPSGDVHWKARRNVAAFICESILSCGGQIVLPPGYLAEAYRIVRAAGGLCIADEVQTGFGRVGSHFWAFETQGVVPDILTLGKPIGNGHPLGAVITTPEIAASFHNGLEYFNTFGGNPVSCAIGLAVLDVIEEEGLQQRALDTGARLMDGLGELMSRHSIIGDVRGLGLFCGFELVRDRKSLEPAAHEASYLVNRMKDHGVLLSTDGPFDNVIKIKPPLCFDESNIQLLLSTLDHVLQEDFLRTS